MSQSSNVLQSKLNYQQCNVALLIKSLKILSDYVLLFFLQIRCRTAAQTHIAVMVISSRRRRVIERKEIWYRSKYTKKKVHISQFRNHKKQVCCQRFQLCWSIRQAFKNCIVIEIAKLLWRHVKFNSVI